MNRGYVLLLAIAIATLVGCSPKESAVDTPHSTPMPTAASADSDEFEFNLIGEIPGIYNYVVQYSDDVYRGGKVTSKKGMKYLKETLGIKTIISILPSENERAWAKSYGILVVEVPFDLPLGPTGGDVRFMLEVINDQTACPVYIHCGGGTQRGNLMCTYYREDLGWDPEKVHAEYKALGGRD